jgi:DNA-binding response OmpR family regulator
MTTTATENSPTALVVDDEPQMTTIIEFALQTQGFTVHTAHNGATALNVLRTRQVDLVVLDVMMPVLDGRTLCRQIRETSDVPIMMLTALGQPEEIISGLEHGADDYVTKPFHPREVALRAQALVRRSRGVGAEPVLQIGRLRIDPTHHIASLAGNRLDLPFTEFKLLAHLAAHRGVPQPWRTLLQAVWDVQNLAGGRDIVKSAVYRLRSRLAALDDSTEYILTLRGAGYLVPDLPPTEDPAPQPDHAADPHRP